MASMVDSNSSSNSSINSHNTSSHLSTSNSSSTNSLLRNINTSLNRNSTSTGNELSTISANVIINTLQSKFITHLVEKATGPSEAIPHLRLRHSRRIVIRSQVTSSNSSSSHLTSKILINSNSPAMANSSPVTASSSSTRLPRNINSNNMAATSNSPETTLKLLPTSLLSSTRI